MKRSLPHSARPDISAQVLQLLKQMMTDTAELMGASEAALGTVNPDNTSAIIAVQNATAAPLELTKMEFYRFTEDWARVFLDLMGAHYGVRTLVLPNEDGGEPEKCTFDFSALAGQDMRLQVDVGAASYWSGNHADDDKRSSAGERRYFRPARISGKRTGLSGTRQT